MLVTAVFLIGVGMIGTIHARREQGDKVAAAYCKEPKAEGCETLKANVRAASANEDAVDVAVWALGLAATGLIGVGFTVFYAQRAFRETQRSADAAIDDFASNHRPKLKIRQFTIGTLNECPNIQFMVVNIGNTEATLIERNHSVVYGPFGTSRGPLTNNTQPNYEQVNIGPGQFHYINLTEAPVDSPEGWQPALDVAVGNKPLFVFGYVTYRDRSGAFRRSGYLREYDPEKRRFAAVELSEYEYMD